MKGVTAMTDVLTGSTHQTEAFIVLSVMNISLTLIVLQMQKFLSLGASKYY